MAAKSACDFSGSNELSTEKFSLRAWVSCAHHAAASLWDMGDMVDVGDMAAHMLGPHCSKSLVAGCASDWLTRVLHRCVGGVGAPVEFPFARGTSPRCGAQW